MLLARDIARALDPVRLAEACGVTPDDWQSDTLRSDAKRMLLLCARQTGKTTVTGIKALHKALYTSDSLSLILSPSQRQSAEMLRSLMALHARLDDAPSLDTSSVLKAEFANGSRILALPGTEATVRGFAGVDLAILDEAARIDDDLIAAVRPMLATKPDAQLIALTTPAGRRGFFFDAWHGDGDWTRVKVTAAECPRISAEFLAEELRELGPQRFSEEYELVFRDSDEAAFLTGVIDKAISDEVEALWQ